MRIIWELCEVMKYLQADPTADQRRLAVLEWKLLPLARHDHFQPTLLHSELSQNPLFFAEVISAAYRARNQPKDENPDQMQRNLALAGYSLLESWVGIPGAESAGTIDGNALRTWIVGARKICAANGRIEICDEKIGEQLSCASADSDGMWPCQTVREVLETVASDEIMQGFNTGVLNQRGATCRGLNDGGEQERELAKKYRFFAEKCKIVWPRTALALRRIAEFYENQAKWQDERAESRD